MYHKRLDKQGLDQGALHELASLINPAAVPGADLVLVSRTYIRLQHHGGVGGLNQLLGGILGAPQGGTGQFRAENARAGLMLLHGTNEVLHAPLSYHPRFSGVCQLIESPHEIAT